MRRSSPARAPRAQSKGHDMLVPSFYIEEEEDEPTKTQAGRSSDSRLAYAMSLGNGGYVTMAHSMSDDAKY